MRSAVDHYEFPTVNKNRLLAKLRALIGTNNVLSADEELQPYECDGLTAYKQLPLAVLLPETNEQIQTILRYCHQERVPVVARGAGTSLSGGALPHAQGVLLSLAKFTQILEIDLDNLCARVQSGVRNLAISEAVAEHDLYYAPDPSSQIACSIGGNVAENAGGLHCLKYGLTVHNVLAVTLVTMEGELLTLGSKSFDTPGYDLLALIHGSEGMLGVIVEVVVRLLPKPETASVMLAAFKNIHAAGDAVGSIISQGIIPAGLEMMDRAAIHAAEDFVHAGYPLDAEAILLCELDGCEAEVNVQLEKVAAIMRSHAAYLVRIAENESERTRFWLGRKSAFPAVGRISPDYFCMDGTIPRKNLAEILQHMQQLSAEYGLSICNVFHAGDGNLHPLILFDASNPGELEKAETLGGKILEACVKLGGTITGEHGVGIEKIGQMCVQFDRPELLQFHALKRAFDPQGLLNPGKAIPTLRRCAEFGALHVHNGQVPHPDIPRF